MNAVEFENITKRFGSFIANDDISLIVNNNSVHCILGENGAGKSTLMKILFGIYEPDSGSIKVFDKEVDFKTPHDAIDAKIGMVHQHFMLIDDFTILENVILGNEIVKGLSLNFKETENQISELVNKYNLGLDLNKKISNISISEQQKVEILKLLFRNSEILIFDEPTAVLSPVEVDEFFKIVNTFKSDGKTIILITHKLNEVKQISDRVSVLRKGKLVYETDNVNNQLDIDELSSAIVGEALLRETIKKIPADNKKEQLSLKNVSLKKNNVNVLSDLDLILKSGEIHGICGVEGNGQNEITDIIIGLEKDFEGELISGEQKISLVPDDRIKKGMIKEYNIGENMILKNSSKRIISKSYLQEISSQIIKDYDVRCSEIDATLGSMSGGNQQKVIVAREMAAGSKIMIFSHPTRGVDINATQFIHNEIIDQRNYGKPVLLISSDLDELIALSDRLSILYNGRIVKTFESSDLESFKEDNLLPEIDASSNRTLYDEIGRLMIGIKP